MEEDRANKKSDVLKAFAKNLVPHFDSIRVFATVHDAEGSRTFSFTEGFGNVQAQAGQVRDWLIEHDARTFRHGWETAYETPEEK